MSWFYSGFWAVDNGLIIDKTVWRAPDDDNTQWAREGGAVEDLNMRVEDIDVFPEEMLSGWSEWSEVTVTDTAVTFYSIFADDYADFTIPLSENFYMLADPILLGNTFYIIFDEPDTTEL